ncbi:MAG TPA: transposase [Chryseobacterium indologenes]|nr:transposase [Chryseobacterium indologenes]
MKTPEPNYKQIYSDIISYKHPDKYEDCIKILNKKKLSFLDVIELNDIIFGAKTSHNQKYKSYDRSTIVKILHYQKQTGLNNTQVAEYFNLSKKSVTRWKKNYLV